MPNGWNLTLKIPTQLFEGEPQGMYITHRYSVSTNGSFSASDDSGNSFSTGSSVPKLLGIASTKLIGNSTKAVESTVIAIGTSVIANVSLAFSIRRQFCQPAGLKVTISGTVNWGPQGKGSIIMPFNKVPLSVKHYRVWLGNSSGVSLGFDWADSASLNPSYDSKANTLSWTVGQTFTIDPVVIGSTTGGTPYDFQRGCYDQILGRFWCFYSDGTNLVFRSSTDAVTWSSSTAVRADGQTSCYSTAADYVNNKIYYAVGCPFISGSQIFYRGGTLHSDGTVSWDFSEVAVATAHTIGYDNTPGLTAALTPSGNLYIAVGTEISVYHHSCDCSTYTVYTEVYKCASPIASCTPTKVYDSPGDSNGGITQPLIFSFSGSSLALLTIKSGINYVTTCPSTCASQADWSSAVSSGDLSTMTGGTALGSTLYFTLRGSATTIKYWSCAYPCSSVLSETTLTTSKVDIDGLSMSSDNANRLVVTYCDIVQPSTDPGLTKCGHFLSSDLGTTWGPDTTDTSTPTRNFWDPNWNERVASNNLAGSWMQGSSSPTNVEFYAVPLTAPQAALSTNAWSKAGLSPYENYLTNLADSVSPGNGLLSIEQGTVSLPGRGLGVASALVYTQPGAFRSTSAWATDNFTLANVGLGWSLNLPWLGTNYLHLPGGQAIPYKWVGTTFEYHGAEDFVLANSGTYSLSMGDGTVWGFNSAKQLTSETDPNGNQVTFQYGTSGYLSTITDTVGRQVSFSYNANNQLSTIASAGRTWSLGYSGNNLVTLTDPLNRVTTYQYSSGLNSWLVSGIIYPTGGQDAFSYSSAPVWTEVTTDYVTSRTIYSSSSPLTISRSDSFFYNIVNGQVIWSNNTESNGISIQGFIDNHFIASAYYQQAYSKGGSGNTISSIRQTFDTNGRITSVAHYSSSGAFLASSGFSYDDWGNLVYSTDNVGQQTWLSYANTNSANNFGTSVCTVSFYTNSIASNIHNRLVGACDFQGGPSNPQQSTYNLYDSNGNLLEQKVAHSGGFLYTDFTYDTHGNVLSAKNARGFFVYFRYSSTYNSAYLTKRSQLVGTQNITSTYAYDFSKGFLLSKTDPNGQTISFQYDSLGRPTLITFPAVGGISATRLYQYDDANNVLTATDEDGHVTKQYYDGLERMTKVERWNGSSVYSTAFYGYTWLNEVGTVTTPAGGFYSYAYDSVGRQTVTTYPDSNFTTSSYDDTNNVVTVADGNGHQTVYAYDWNGRLVSVQKAVSSTTTYTASYGYDSAGNLISLTDNNHQQTTFAYDDLNRLSSASYPDGHSESEAYDSVGNPATKTTPNNALITYTFDAANRLTNTAYPDGTASTYAYDADSNVLTATTSSPSTAETYAYDARDRLTSLATTVGGSTYTDSYTLDAAGNILRMTYPDGYALPMTYDGMSRLKTVGTFATLAYTLDDQVSKVTFGDGEVQTYTYNLNDEPRSITDAKGGTTYLSLAYNYDKTGNILSIGGDSYTYDWSNRVIAASGGWGSINYNYDGNGNPTSVVTNGATNTFTYGSYNSLTSTSNPAVSYTYDNDGNTKTKSGGWTYTYNFDDELTKVVQNGVTKQTNVYDAMGERVQKTESDSTIFTYQGVNVLYEKDTTTGVAMKHFYAGGMQVAKMVGASNYYFHGDQVSSTRLVKDSSLNAVFSSDYTPFGTNSGASGSETFMFAGKPDDSTTNLYYFGARFYDATIGRFITRDSYLGALSDPTSQNRYIYAEDNPLRFTDPTGNLVYPVINWDSIWSYVWKALGLPLESQARHELGLPICDQECQRSRESNWRTVSILAGIVFPGGDFESSLDNSIVIDSTPFRPFSPETEEAIARDTPGIRQYQQGSYGRDVADFYLRSKGTSTLREFEFRTSSGRLRPVDLYDPTTGIAYEVKTGRFESSPYLRDQANDLRYAVRSGQFTKVVYLNVGFVGEIGFESNFLEHLAGPEFELSYLA